MPVKVSLPTSLNLLPLGGPVECVVLDEPVESEKSVELPVFPSRMEPVESVEPVGSASFLTPRFSFPVPSGSWLSDALLLQLSDLDIQELRATGDRTIVEFTAGGLRKGLDIAADRRMRMQYVNFSSAFLIERAKWADPRYPLSPRNGVTYEQCAVAPRVEASDLFVASNDVDRLRLGLSSNWDCVDYPFKGSPENPVPIAIYWLYQASLALMKMPESKPSDAKKWLRRYADKKAYSLRRIDTVAVLAHPEYKLASRFDAVNVLDFYSRAQSLSENLPVKPVLLLMAIAEWWSEEAKTWAPKWESLPKKDRGEYWMPLARKLKEARFDQTVTQPLTSIISGFSVPDEDWKEAKETLGPWLKYRVGDGQS